MSAMTSSTFRGVGPVFYWNVLRTYQTFYFKHSKLCRCPPRSIFPEQLGPADAASSELAHPPSQYTTESQSHTLYVHTKDDGTRHDDHLPFYLCSTSYVCVILLCGRCCCEPRRRRIFTDIFTLQPCMRGDWTRWRPLRSFKDAVAVSSTNK